MGVMLDPRSHRAVWSYLRRTRQRVTGMAREQPAYAPRLSRVIAALAAEESALIAEDPELPFRTNRGPKAFDPATRDATLAARITELEGLVRAREEQIALLAHDLRVPLSPLLRTLRRLQEDATTLGDGTMSARDVRARLDAALHRCTELRGKLDAMIEGTHLQLAQIALEPEELDLTELTLTIVDEVRREIGTRSVIHLRAPERLIGTWDRARIEQILRNLLTNAIQHGAMQPIDVTLEGAPDGDLATIIVRDHGIGIPEHDHQRIFDKRVKLSAHSKGLGLGLWIVRELVQAMRGIVRVDSTPGRGAAFYVTLPRGAAQRMLAAEGDHFDGGSAES